MWGKWLLGKNLAVAYSRNSVVVNPLCNFSLHIFPLVSGCGRDQSYTRLGQRPALQDAEQQRVVEELEDHDPKIEDPTDHNRWKVVAPTLKKNSTVRLFGSSTIIPQLIRSTSLSFERIIGNIKNFCRNVPFRP